MARLPMIPIGTVFLAVCCLAPRTNASTDIWVSYIASQGGWKTSVSVYFSGVEPTAPFTLTRMEESGNVLADRARLTAGNNIWTSLPAASLDYEGSARIRSKSDLVVKVCYRNGESPEICEVRAPDATGQEWVLSNPVLPWADSAQIALVNSNDKAAAVTLEAWKNGRKVASRSAELAARSRFVNTSADIWNGLAYGEFDRAVVRASAPIPAPALIAGNLNHDRLSVSFASRTNGGRTLCLINGTVIDGTGREPISDAVVVIRNGKILAVGKRGEIAIPGQAETFDANGGFILPGFINTHVHYSADLANLKTWAWGGVTTVRDVGAPHPAGYVFSFLDSVRSDATCARVVAAGPHVTVPGGYPIVGHGFPSLTVTSPEEARTRVNELIDLGAGVIKITLEDGAGAVTPAWPTLTPEEVQAIVETAHARGIPVTAHISITPFLRIALDAGVDDTAHSMFNNMTDYIIGRMIRSGMALCPTLKAQGMYPQTLVNLKRFVEAGGKVAMGNDGGETGIPILELEAMQEAGMTPMQIITASTKNAAEVCRLDKILGTIEFDKEADILIVRKNPLESLRALIDVERVIHGGTVIR